MVKLKLGAAALLAVALLSSTACSPQATHPNQINAFDGASYDSLTAAHAALTSLRGTIATGYPQYVSTFNQAAASYQLAYNAYVTFRTAPANQAQAALAIDNLTVAIVNLEDAFQTSMNVTPATANTERQRVYKLRSAYPNLSISDILTELQVAATIAATIPGTQPYAALAQIVIGATRSAIDATTAEAGQAIDLTTIAPVPAIS